MRDEIKKLSNGLKILSLSLDNSVLDKDSKLAKRIVEYGNLAEKYIVIVPSQESKETILSEQVRAIGIGACNRIFALFKIYKIARRLLFEEKFNIITVQDQYYLGLAGCLLSKKFGIGLEIQVHGFEKYYRLRKAIAKFVIPKANAIRAVSQRLKKRLVSEFGVEEDKITVVPIYSDFRSWISGAGIESGKNDKFIFLTVARLVPVKNVKMQIRAIKNLELRIKNLELWILGDGAEMKNLKHEIGNLGLESNVKFFGWQEDPRKFYSRADAFLLTSDYEGWGLAVIEAAAMGLPIIMTDVGCACQVIKNKESGLVIPTGGQKELERAMEKLIKSDELRKKLGAGARQAVLNLPSKKDTLGLYMESWEKAKKD